MSIPSDQRYDVFFAGECRQGHEPQAVRAALGKLFSADAVTLDRLFSGKRQRIKRNCDESTALKYKNTMRAAGALAAIEPVQGTGEDAPGTSIASQEAPPFTVAPPGSEVLTAQERAVPINASIDTSQFALCPDGPMASGTPPTHEAPDTSALSLTEGPLNLSDCARPAPAEPILDLDDLRVADVGSYLGQVSHQQPVGIAAPDLPLVPRDERSNNG